MMSVNDVILAEGGFYTLPRGLIPPPTFLQHPWLPLLITSSPNSTQGVLNVAFTVISIVKYDAS